MLVLRNPNVPSFPICRKLLSGIGASTCVVSASGALTSPGYKLAAGIGVLATVVDLSGGLGLPDEMYLNSTRPTATRTSAAKEIRANMVRAGALSLGRFGRLGGSGCGNCGGFGDRSGSSGSGGCEGRGLGGGSGCSRSSVSSLPSKSQKFCVSGYRVPHCWQRFMLGVHAVTTAHRSKHIAGIVPGRFPSNWCVFAHQAASLCC